nr:NUDIX domain-containing protein [Micromonospora sp. DSM 115978]
MQRLRRIGGYGICDNGDAVLLVRASGRTPVPGVWQVPGGGVGQGEDPADTVVREYAEETGLAVRVTGLRAVVADVIASPALGVAMHTDRVVYDVTVTGGALRAEPAGGALRAEPAGGALRAEPAGSTDRVEWVPRAVLAGHRLMPFTAELLGVPVEPLTLTDPGRPVFDPPAPDTGQRFAAYGLVTEPGGRVLLTEIAAGYPGAGRWHLPGGGTDHGEQPATGLLRELVEETSQLGRVLALLDVSNWHDPAALGPEGRPIDWHVVRALYRVRVEAPTEPVVREVGGSTVRARWFSPREAAALPLTEVAADLLRRLESDSAPAK